SLRADPGSQDRCTDRMTVKQTGLEFVERKRTAMTVPRPVQVSLLLWSTVLSVAVLPDGLNAAEPLPTERLAMVTFTGADLDKTQKFYTDIMGFPVVRQTKDDTEKVNGLYFKVNDEQFLAFFDGGPGGEPFRLRRLSFLTPEISRTHAWVSGRQLAPRAVE